MKGEKDRKSNRASAAKKTKTPTAIETVSNGDFSDELNAPRWSVVSFESRVAGNLTYDKALKKLKQLEAKKISGLCIITDEAANRISK